MKSLKILIISGWKIFPTETGGHLRSGSFAKALARLGHEVRLYSLAGRREDYQRSSPLLALHVGGYFEQEIEAGLIEEVHCGWLLGLFQALGRRLGQPRVWQYLLLERGWIPRRLKKALARADLIIYDLPYCPPIRGPWGHKESYLLSHNLEHRLLLQGSSRERAWSAWMQGVEARARQRYKAILACAPEDQQYFLSQKGAAPVALLQNGIDSRAYQRDSAERERIRALYGLGPEDWLIVFSGSRFEPNLEALEALKAFAREEANFLAKHRIHFLVLGSMASPFREGALIATGRVPSTFPYFSAADAALNPVVRGSGSNVKLYEYLAAQLPILSTSFGVRGTSLLAGRDFILSERAELKNGLSQLLQRSQAAWRLQAAEVWERHRQDADMEAIAARVLKLLDSE